MANDIRRVNMVSTGQLLSGLSAERVIQRLNQRFGVTERQATAMLRKGTVLKKAINVEDAKKISLVFSRLGLKVMAQSVRQPAPGNAKVPPPPVRTVRPSAASARTAASAVGGSSHKVNTLLSENINPPAMPFYLSSPLLMTLTGALPGLLVPALYASVVILLLVGLVGDVWSLAAIAFGDETYNAFTLTLAVSLAIVQLLLLLFLLKPVFAKRSQWSGTALWREESPAFFALVEELCDRMGVPYPTRICVNNTVRAEVSPVGGVAGVFHRRYQLTIGLPLVLAMNKRELAAAFAQPLSYCTGAATFQTYCIIHYVNAWLAKRVFDFDLWDNRLEDFIQHSRYRSVRTLADWVQRGFSGTSLLLYGLWVLNRHITAFTARKLDFNADYYGATASGSKVFVANTKTLVALAAARQQVLEMNARAWTHRKLLADLPAAIGWVLNQMDAATRNRLVVEQEPFPFQHPTYQDMGFQNPGTQNIALESAAALNVGAHAHPDDVDRVNKVEAQGRRGLCYANSNALINGADLFKNFEGLCAEVTAEEYQSGGLDAYISDENLHNKGLNPERFVVDNSQILELNESMESAEIALADYMGSRLEQRILAFDEVSDEELVGLNPQQIIDWIRQKLMEYRENQKHFPMELADVQHKYLGECYVKAGIAVDAKHFGFVSTQKACVDDAMKNANNALKSLTERLHQVDRMFLQRIKLTFPNMHDGERKVAKRYFSTLQKMTELQALLQQLQLYRFMIGTLSGKKSEPWLLESDWLGKAQLLLKEQANNCAQQMLKIVEISRSITVSNDTGEEQSLCDVILARTGEMTSSIYDLPPLILVGLAKQLESALYEYYGYRLGRLAEICSRVEQRMGLKPLKLYRETH
ncbi:MAG: M48 family metallopeptidase [Exilibacterium sp.]